MLGSLSHGTFAGVNPTMSKCHVRELSNVFRCLIRDAADAFPAYAKGLEKDLTRIVRTVDYRGIHLYLVDLPNLGKHFDKCLSMGFWAETRLPLGKRTSSGNPLPRFLYGLFIRVFDSDGCLREDADSEAVFFIRQILLLAKKTVLECRDEDTRKTFREFYELDSTLPEPEWPWCAPDGEYFDTEWSLRGFSEYFSSDDCSSVGESMEDSLSAFLGTLEKISDVVATTLGSYDPLEWKFRHGPGAIAETTKVTNKYYWTNWSNRLEAVFPIADCGFHSHSAWAHRVATDGWSSCERASRLIAVPKTYTKPRLIAAEPSENQWCQQNIWRFLANGVASSWIWKFVRFSDQTYNQELCLQGSKDRSVVTVDLSSASDRVSCKHVQMLFRSNPRLLKALQASRTRFIEQSKYDDLPHRWELRKFSTMGNACTFPVESLLFLSIVLASVCYKRGIRVTQRNLESLEGEVAIFGDDLIVPEDSWEVLDWALRILDFEVNTDKTFTTGNFRESCGVDAFRGEVVTPIYWRMPCTNTAESIASTIDVRNNFYSKFLLRTARRVGSPLRKFGICAVAMDSGVQGQKSRLKPERHAYKLRWNRNLHRMEAFVPLVTTKARKTPILDDSALLQYFTEAPPSYQKWVGGITQRPKLTLRRHWVPLDCLNAQ